MEPREQLLTKKRTREAEEATRNKLAAGPDASNQLQRATGHSSGLLKPCTQGAGRAAQASGDRH
ncbi:hypothetical protein BRADI_1g22866v3 [Brachypodium distachyon]|uniref:Uncharacterized protein n=1 Tax=Brachypodium distachyon TaxID=15368 RepID=A0A2K2DKL9_BRADI|nr:hypothetical protein BRADI_1g22866v3 [Brachypodium distachyon]